jgi:threonine dehydrogenase-like Zn-dependent dehydrogenase
MMGRAHFVTGGGFAEYTMWPEWQLHKIPENVSNKAAVLMEPTAGSIHSIVTRMGVKAGESVAILGPGARGLLMLQVCRAIGAGPILMSGVTRDEPYRLAMAKKLGADVIVNVEKDDLRQKVSDMTGGIGVDVVLENTGAVEPIAESLDIVRKGGRVMWAGGGIKGGIVAPVDTHKIIVKELDVRGEISQMPYDWETAVHFAATGRIEMESLVTHIFPIEKWHEGFTLAASSHDCLRVAIKP